MLENLITPEFLAKQEGISVEEARAALAANTKLNQELDDTLQKAFLTILQIPTTVLSRLLI